MSDLNVEVNVEAWFSPRFEYIETESSVTVVVYCRICAAEITRRGYSRFSSEVTETIKEEATRIRKDDAHVDGLHFIDHLEKMHPERYTEGNAS